MSDFTVIVVQDNTQVETTNETTTVQVVPESDTTVQVEQLVADVVVEEANVTIDIIEASPIIVEVLENTYSPVDTSASPGFSFGRSSNVLQGTWLLNESVPSNKAGRFVYINDASVQKIFVSNEISTTFDLEIYYHYGNEIGLTLVDTINVVSDYGGVFTIGQTVPTGSQLALKVSSGSARNIIAGLELLGNN